MDNVEERLGKLEKLFADLPAYPIISNDGSAELGDYQLKCVKRLDEWMNEELLQIFEDHKDNFTFEETNEHEIDSLEKLVKALRLDSDVKYKNYLRENQENEEYSDDYDSDLLDAQALDQEYIKINNKVKKISDQRKAIKSVVLRIK